MRGIEREGDRVRWDSVRGYGFCDEMGEKGRSGRESGGLIRF